MKNKYLKIVAVAAAVQFSAIVVLLTMIFPSVIKWLASEITLLTRQRMKGHC